MSAIRQPAVAGHFYPADAAEITNWLATLPVSEPLEFYPPRMLLMPMQYVYSGALAALAISRSRAIAIPESSCWPLATEWRPKGYCYPPSSASHSPRRWARCR